MGQRHLGCAQTASVVILYIFYPVWTQCLNICKNCEMLLLSSKHWVGAVCSHQSGASIHLLACIGIRAATFWLVDVLPLLFYCSHGVQEQRGSSSSSCNIQGVKWSIREALPSHCSAEKGGAPSFPRVHIQLEGDIYLPEIQQSIHQST